MPATAVEADGPAWRDGHRKWQTAAMSPAPALETSAPARVLLIDDQEDFRFLLSLTFGREGSGTEVIGEASDGPSGIDEVARLQPDVVILDYRMPGMNGIEAATLMLDANPDLRVVLCTAYPSPELEEVALTLGIRATISKTRLGDLPNLVRRVLDDDGE